VLVLVLANMLIASADMIPNDQNYESNLENNEDIIFYIPVHPCHDSPYCEEHRPVTP